MTRFQHLLIGLGLAPAPPPPLPPLQVIVVKEIKHPVVPIMLDGREGSLSPSTFEIDLTADVPTLVRGHFYKMLTPGDKFKIRITPSQLLTGEKT